MDIKVLGKIRHDRKVYDHGDTIKKIKREEGERLINLGAAEELGKKVENEVENEDDKKKINEETESEEASD